MEAQALLMRSLKLLRLRRGLGGAAFASTGLLLCGAVLHLLGGELPAPAWAVVPVGAAIGALLPRDPERGLLWAGRRLGVGGRLAALWLVLAREEGGLAELLRRELCETKLEWIRLLTGRGTAATALSLSLSLAAFLLLPPISPSTGVVPSSELKEAVLPEEATSEPAPETEVAVQPAAPERLALPEDVATSLPFQDLLAEIYGLTPTEGPLASGELTDEVQAQQGLLRQLAQELSQLAPGGLSQTEQRALLPLIQQLAREDLREQLVRLVEQADEEAAQQAVQAVEAVRRAEEELMQKGSTPTARAGKGTEAGQGEGQPALATASGEGGVPAAGERPESLGEELAEEEGELAGLAPGEDSSGGEEPPLGQATAKPVAPEVRPGEGGARGYLAAGVPVEPEGAAPGGTAAYSPEEAELVLRARGVPLELRGVVRRYFEILSQGGD